MRTLKKGKVAARLVVAVLTVAMMFQSVPLAFAESGSYGSGEITGFEPLDAGVAAQSVPLGTDRQTLTLPETLAAAVFVEPVEEDTQTPEPGTTGVDVPVQRWEAAPEYDPDTEGEYIFTPVLPDGWILAGGGKAFHHGNGRGRGVSFGNP